MFIFSPSFLTAVDDHKTAGLQKTSRDRPKSAPYLRLKNSKKTSKCQVFSFTVLENRKFYEKKFFEKITPQKKWTAKMDSKKLFHQLTVLK